MLRANESTRRNRRAKALSELVPWLLPLTDRVVLNKDGSLMACYAFDGQDMEGWDAGRVDQTARQIAQAMQVPDENGMLWWTVRREKVATLDPGTFPDGAAQRIEEAYLAAFNRRPHYVNRHYLSVVYTPSGNRDRLFEVIDRRMRSGEGGVRAIKGAVAELFSDKGQALANAEEIDGRLRRLEDVLGRFVPALPEIGMRRLAGSELFGFLNSLLSPASEAHPVALDEDDYLDSQLGQDGMAVFADRLRFEGESIKEGAALAVKGWPKETTPELLDGLLGVEAELTFTMAFSYMEQEAGRKYIKDQRRHHMNLRKGLFTLIKETATGTESENVNTDHEIKAQDADLALAEFAEHPILGYTMLSVMVYADDDEDLDEAVRKVVQQFQRAEFNPLRERIHLVSAWAGTLPGQWSEPIRWEVLTGNNGADLAPVRGDPEGEPTNPHLSEQLGYTVPALTVLETETATPFFWNLHEGQLGHAIVLGPSRTGKSVFMNFLWSQFRRIQPNRVFVFDKDHSARIPITLQGGAYMDLGRERVRLNPLAHIEDENDLAWFRNWLEILIGARGYELTAEDDEAIQQALTAMFKGGLSRENRRLVTLTTGLLPSHLSDQLRPWVGDGQWARYFDHAEDEFDVADLVGMEMGTILNNENPVVFQALIEYFFHRINRSLERDRVPTFIYIEEAWALLASDRFAGRLDDWLRTLAKRNGLVTLASQGLHEIEQSRIFRTMVEGIPNKIFLPNRNALTNRDLYQGAFGLSEAQVDRIRYAIPKSDYYIIKGDTARMARIQLPPEVVAHLRSDMMAQQVMDRVGREHYVEEVLRGGD